MCFLRALSLHHFRNHQKKTLFFSSGINYIHGENARGKTNLLEAIYLLIFGRSFRTPRLDELILFGTSSFAIEAQFEKNGIEQVLKFEFESKKKKITHNATTIFSLHHLLGIVNGVLISPEDRDLIMGDPSIRRQYLDLQIAQTNPLYLHHLLRYLKAMKQRNALLRNQEKKTIEIWEEEMAHSAAYITCARYQAIQELQLLSLDTLSREIDTLSLSYKTHAPVQEKGNQKEYFLEKFSKYRMREYALGFTLVGPHRDDLEILLGGRPARFFGSEGQKRCSITALRFAQWKRLKEQTLESPLLCIDDVGVTLDAHREEKLLASLGQIGQVFLTSPRLPTATYIDTHFIHLDA